MKQFSSKFNLIIFGPQGSGKTAQAELLAKKFNLEIIAPGDMARKEARKFGPLAQKIQKYLKKGELLPDDIIKNLIWNKLSKIKKKGIIFDGFPRDLNQTKILEKYLAKLKLEKPVAIFLKVSKKIVLSRIAARRVCPECEQVFWPKSKGYRRGVCPKCKVKIIQREDDNPKTVKKRLEIYFTQTQKIIRYFRQMKRLIEINGEPQIPEVYRDILEELNDYFKK